VEQRRAAAGSISTLLAVGAQGARTTRGLIEGGRLAVGVAGEALTDDDAEVRRQALRGLYQAAQALADLIVLPDPADIPSDVSNLTPEDRTRLETMRARAEEDSKTFLPLTEALAAQTPAVGRAVLDPDPQVRLLARQTAERIANAGQRLQQSRKRIPTLPDRTQGPGRGGILVAALHAHVHADPPPPRVQRDPIPEALRGILPQLVRGLRDPNPKIRLAALDAIETIGPDAATPEVIRGLVAALGDPYLFVRWQSARALGKMQPTDLPEEIVAGLVPLLKDEDLDVRLAAALALERVGPPAAGAIPALAEATRCNDPEMRVAAIRALQGIGTASAAALPALIDAMGHEDPRVRRAAAELLGRLGPLARDAAPVLRRALRDEDPEVRRIASEALLAVLGH
jgi:HEAT repeat protein